MVKKVIRFIVLIIGLSLVAYSGYHLFKIYSDYNTSDKTYEKLQDDKASVAVLMGVLKDMAEQKFVPEMTVKLLIHRGMMI